MQLHIVFLHRNSVLCLSMFTFINDINNISLLLAHCLPVILFCSSYFIYMHNIYNTKSVIHVILRLQHQNRLAISTLPLLKGRVYSNKSKTILC